MNVQLNQAELQYTLATILQQFPNGDYVTFLRMNLSPKDFSHAVQYIWEMIFTQLSFISDEKNVDILNSFLENKQYNEYIDAVIEISAQGDQLGNTYLATMVQALEDGFEVMKARFSI